VSLLIAAFPVSQHLAVIALFLAVFYAMLKGNLGAAEVGWSVTATGLFSYGLYHVGWGRSRPPPVGRELTQS
jgi:phosphatidylinositol glycan class C protein